MRALLALLISCSTMLGQQFFYQHPGGFSVASSSSPSPDLLWYKFTEGSGTTAADSSGHANTGNLNSGATWVTGASGSGFGIQGSGTTNALFSNGNVPYSTNKITITLWLNSASYNTAVKQVFFSTSPDESNDGSHGDAIMWASDGASHNAINIFANGNYLFNTASIGGNQQIKPGSWQFVAVWYDNSATAGTNWCFTNSVLNSGFAFSAANTGTINFTANKFYLDGYLANSPFNASIDDVRVYSGLLTSNQVSQIYADPK